MWSDNEMDIDLLGVDRLGDMLVFLAQEPQFHSLTIGVFADWGSGKSSLMWMAQQRLSAEPERFLCLTTGPLATLDALPADGHVVSINPAMI